MIATQKIEDAGKAIALTTQKLELLKEYREALKYEASKYHLVRYNTERKRLYLLIEIKTKKTVVSGDIRTIVRHYKSRNINKNLIYTA